MLEQPLYRFAQAQVMVEAYEERFGRRPDSVDDVMDAVADGKLDNLPLDEDGRIDVWEWRARKLL